MPEAKKKQWWHGWEQLATSEVEQMPRLAEEEEDNDWGEEAEEVVTSVWGTPNGGCGCSCYDPSYRQAMKAMISAIEEQGCDVAGMVVVPGARAGMVVGLSLRLRKRMTSAGEEQH
ncbi:hypothetical protein B296_00001254 [Ensete ventricosum]|uniref:Uncharacterized protein n=1 Tax=Ensete ventricosum TaxID=4639 RepID=A0A427B1C3_ENSVE|nr:hypothetical protein B296_00001254 [Ensete ventricosum]